MTLSVNDGTLYLGTGAGLASSSGNGSGAISMSGTLAALDAALDGLEYFPNSGYSGDDTLALSLTDGADQQTANLPITVLPQAPAPSFSLGPDQEIPAGVGAQTISGWATGITSGLTDGTSATLNFIVSANNSAGNYSSLFSVQPVIDSNGDLTYTPAAGASGVATISVALQATPTSGGSPVTSAASTFTIVIGSNADGTSIEPELFAPSSELLPWGAAPGSEVEFGSPDQNGVYVAGDTDTTAQVSVTISTSSGWLNMGNDSNAILTNDNTSQVTVSGGIADVNTDLASLNLTSPSGPYTASGTITVSLTSSSTGSGGGTVSVTDNVPLTFVDVSSSTPSTGISISLPNGQAVPENNWLTFSSATGNPIVINADPTAEAEVTITDDSELGDSFSLASTSGLTMLAGSGSGDSIETFTGTVADINTALDGLEFSSAYNGTPNLMVLAMLVDGSGSPTGDSAVATTSVTVRSAPSFNAYTGLWLSDQPEYSSELYSATGDDPVQGTPVSEILFPPLGSEMNPNYYSYENGDGYSIGTEDTDANDLLGIAITGLDTQNGTWQVSPDDGLDPYGNADWQTIGSVSDANALLLDSSDDIRFVPNAGYFGDVTDAVTFRLWDETTGTSMTYADVSNNGGTTAYSADTATAALRVDPLVSITGGGGSYTISATSAVPWDLDVSGYAGWTWGPSGLPFTVVIPAGQSSTTLDLSGLWNLDPGYDSNYEGPTSLTVTLTGPGGDGDPPAGYDYQVAPSAGSVSTTEGGDGNDTSGPIGFVSAIQQNGNTMQVTLANAGAATAMNWSTADGTAIAGQDYQSASGSVSAGGTETVDITLNNIDAPGDSAFLIVMTTTPSGYSSPVTSYYAVTIQTVGLQLLADSNNDGRIDAESDAAANATDVSSSSGGAFVVPNPSGPAGQLSDQLVASDELVPIDLDFNAAAGENITLSAEGATQDFQVYADEGETMPISVAGAGTTWASNLAPAVVWVASTVADQMTLVATATTASGSAVGAPQQVEVNSAILRLSPAQPGQGGIPGGPNGQVNIIGAFNDPRNTIDDAAHDLEFYQAAGTGDILPAVSSLNDLGQRLATYDDGSINVLTVMGHGSGTGGVVLMESGTGVNAYFSYNSIKADPAFAALLKSKLAPNATIVLYGCLCGLAEQNIQSLADILGCKICAYTGSVSDPLAGLEYEPGGQWLQFSPNPPGAPAGQINKAVINPATNPRLFGVPTPAPPSAWDWIFNGIGNPLGPITFF